MSNPYRTAAGFLILGAVLQVVAVLTGGGLAFVLGAVIWLGLAAGLNRAMRGVAYIAFVFTLVAISISIGLLYGSATPFWVLLALAVVNLIAALTLFMALWRPRSAL